jgi:putative ABC transport system permease protein
VFGLALGMASTLIIVLYVHQEFTHDVSFKDHKQIFRVATSFYNLGTFACGPEHLNERLEQFPEIEATVRIEKNNEVVIKNKQNEWIENDVYEVDSTFFQIFDHEFLAGNPFTCLNRPGSIVLSKAIALKYFGTMDVLGETLIVGKKKVEATVKGVVADPINPSHLKATIWMSLNTDEPIFTSQNKVNWNSAYTYNYIKLKQGFGKEALEERILQLIKAEVFPLQGGEQTYDEWIASANAYKLFVQPLSEIYLNSSYRNELSPGGNKNNLLIFTTAAGLLLLLAIVNFINLSTASASNRAKEVGLRKTLGVQRHYLVFQFLVESLLTCLLALGLCLLLAELFLFVYQLTLGQPMLVGIFTNGQVVFWVLAFTFVIAIAAGIYPAFYLTSFQPVKTLKGNFYTSGKQSLRGALVVFQFVISISITAFILIILKQLSFLQNKDLGFDKENILVISKVDKLGSQANAFQTTLKGMSHVKNSAFTSLSPAGSSFWMYTYQTVAMAESVTINTMPCDENVIDVFDIKLLDGRNFDPRLDSVSSVAILNEAAVRDLMLDHPIGEKINQKPETIVIGVVKDFHFKSIHEQIEPLVMVYRPKGSYLTLKLTGNPQPIIDMAQENWIALVPDEPFKYYFVDDAFEQLLKKDKIFAAVISYFCVLTIVISCLGLLGLSLFAAEQRTKEIGIRKVMGASVKSILVLLNNRFTKLIILAIILSIPLSWYVANQWLSRFIYRIYFYWDAFAVTALLMTVLAWIAITTSSWRIVSKNPVETLKCE